MPPVPISILGSDFHLSPRAPSCRVDDDWEDVQRGYLKQVSDLCHEHKVPLVIGGDLFHDGWRSNGCPPWLINLAMECLPTPCYAIYGQHDIPHHRGEDVEKSGLWTLVQAGRITYIPAWQKPGDEVNTTTLSLFGFPWQHDPRPCKMERHVLDNRVRLAVLHRYVWVENHSYHGAPDEARLRHLKDKLAGYDAVLVGDNHSPFLAKVNGKYLLNAGTLIRRRADEMDYKPSVGILYSDGSIKRHFLDTSADRFADSDNVGEVQKRTDAKEFLEELGGLEASSLDFHAAVMHCMDQQQVSQDTREIVLKCLEGK